MKAGITNYEVGTRVRLRGITDPNDHDLNGMVGVLCRPFRNFPITDAGVRLDATECTPEKCRTVIVKGERQRQHTCGEMNVSVYKDEIEIL